MSSRLLSAIALSLAIAYVLSAQANLGRISGTITDASGAVVSDAKITITNTSTELKWTTTSNSSGFYLMPNLPVGTYNVQVEAAGFRPAEKRGFIMTDDGRISADFSLHIVSVNATV